MKDEFSPTGGSINIFRNALKPDFPVVKFGYCLNEMLERPSQPIKTPDNEGVPQGDRILNFQQ
jgi:hypothetical protein